MTPDERIARAADELEVREVLARYSRGVDRADWDLLRSCFADDAIVDYGQIRGTRDELIAFIERELGAMRGLMHMQGQSWLQLDGDSGASETYVHAFHRIQTADGLQDITVHGRYLDALERRDGQWVIVRRTMVDDATTVAPVAGIIDDPALISGARDGTDPSYALFHPVVPVPRRHPCSD
ncbi:MAG: hypothetical protein JWN46_125 [Acidimicrobiales bacterium]|nr:hypothetical protein [Acidimicrobiales bacterium]